MLQTQTFHSSAQNLISYDELSQKVFRDTSRLVLMLPQFLKDIQLNCRENSFAFFFSKMTLRKTKYQPRLIHFLINPFTVV